MLKADLHTHTVASGHGFCTITENAEAAVARGLELIAVTDHGPAVPQGAHPWYYWNLNKAPHLYKGVRILKGCEANIVPDGSVYDSSFGIDIADMVAERLDFVQIGFHPGVGFDAGDRDLNTEALLFALKNPLVDQLNHPGNLVQFPIDIDAVIKAAIEHKVIIELNNSSLDPEGTRSESIEQELDFAAAAYQAGAVVAVGSDAHYFTGIGNFDRALQGAAERGIPEDYFLNTTAERVLAHLEAKRPRRHLNDGPVVD
jgi:putative hydrolase